MRNIVNLLCLRDNIDIDTLSFKLGISKQKTISILKQETIIEHDILLRLADIFNCSIDYLLCCGE